MSLEIPLRYMLWGLLMIVCVTLFSSLLMLSISARRHVIQPMRHISSKLDQVNQHSDLAEIPRDTWEVRELNVLENAFHAQHNKLLAAYVNLEQRAELDPLTGAYTRFKLPRLLELAADRATRREEPLAVALLDLDRFKEINDTYGHDMGDMALKRFSRQLLKVIRSTDNLVRLGGDEFLVILENCERENALLTFDRLREALTEAELNDPLGITIDFSVGVSVFPEDDDSTDVVIKLADARMYENKSARRAHRESLVG